MRFFPAIAACLTAATLFSPVASAAVPSYPSQGDAIYIAGHGACTLGYIEKSTRNGYTAAHCGDKGARVHLMDRKTNKVGPAIGTFYPSQQYDPRGSNDWASIKFDRNVRLGNNAYSGDEIADLGSIKRHVKTCFHGETTHMGSKEISCGTFYKAASGKGMFTAGNMMPQKGDSGGPIWVEHDDGRRQFVGVVSMGPASGNAGAMWLNGIKIEGKPWVLGSPIRNGLRTPEQELADLTFGAAGLTEGRFYDELLSTDKSSESDSSSTEKSSATAEGGSAEGMTPGEIIAVVLPILLAVAGLVSQFMPR